MTYPILAFLISLFISLLLVRYQHLHSKFSGDHQSGPQKFHSHQVSRIGGVSIFLALVIPLVLRRLIDPEFNGILPLLLIASLPVIGIGLSEDITKNIGVKVRLLFTALGAFLFGFLFDAWITKLDVPLIDQLLLINVISIAFTCFAIAGVANAYNIIDGFNGLASMVGIIALFAIGWVGFQVNDSHVIGLSLLMIGAIAGFFVWNYPRGLIFLGDGGAYFIGFYIAALSVYIVAKNPTVSPWFALLVNAYPITETLFTIWRRSVHQGKNPGLPDAAHFHSLIYRRVVRWARADDTQSNQITYVRNAKTSPYLWVLSSLGVFPALVFWNNTLLLEIFSILYCALYIWLYSRVVKFKSFKIPPPKQLKNK